METTTDFMGHIVATDQGRVRGSATEAVAPFLGIPTRWRRAGLPGLIDSAQLLATELVTNAFEHGRGNVGVRLYLTATHLVIEVRDGSHELPVLSHAALEIRQRSCEQWQLP